MTLRGRLLAVAAAGPAFGAVDAATNAAASPYTDVGAALVGTPWQSVAAFTGLIVNGGWAWAALAVAGGWLAGSSGGWRGAAASAATGFAAVLGATVAYFVVDSALKGDPLAGHLTEAAFWAVAALVLCVPLGVVGRLARRPDAVGLLARLVVPAGAALQMVLVPPGYAAVGGLRPWAGEARSTVLVAAGVAAAVAVAVFVVSRRRRVSPPRTGAASPAARSA